MTNTNIIITEAAAIAALRQVAAENDECRALVDCTNLAAIRAVVDGTAGEDDNDGTIPAGDEHLALRRAMAVAMTDGPWWTCTATGTLVDVDTCESLGVATAEQATASYEAGSNGLILIDADGDVVTDGSWEAMQPGVRAVYVTDAVFGG